MPKCFACGAEILTEEYPCPNCGYQFTAGDDRYCPNNNFGICAITENLCTRGIQYQECDIKLKADNEDDTFDLD